jgi:hypothetical protein
VDAITAVVVETGSRGMSPDVIAVGVFSIVGAVAGAVAGLLGERWRRSWGKVRCEIVDWRVSEGPSTDPTERELEVRFVNEKELQVIVLDMRVAFYTGNKPLEERARPALMFGSGNNKTALSPVNVPGRSAVTRTFTVIAGLAEIQQELAATNRAEFVATLVGARDMRTQETGATVALMTDASVHHARWKFSGSWNATTCARLSRFLATNAASVSPT